MIKILILITFIGCKTVSKMKENLKEPFFKYIHEHEASIDFPSTLPNDFYNLKSFELYEDKEDYIFSIKMKEDFTNNLKLPGGWDSILFDIYLKLEDGKNIQALYGRKLKIYSWDKVIVVSPLKISDVKKEINSKNNKVFDDFSIVENLTKDVILPERKLLSANELIISIPKSSLEYKKIESIQLLVMGLDVEGKNYTVKKIKQFADGKSFGGGTSSKENSNVISILGDQEDLKSYYTEGTKIKFAEIKMINIKK